MSGRESAWIATGGASDRRPYGEIAARSDDDFVAMMDPAAAMFRRSRRRFMAAR